MAWPKGKQLQGGKYVIERVLGRGGFGITYLAKTSSGQLYAIKTVNETVESSRDFAKCQRDFFNEVRRIEKCRHQYIVRIEEVIQDGPLSCMVMEDLPGENLKDKVENGSVLSEAEALRFIRQIGEALIEVHNKGFLHRDVKPENIMLRGNESEAVLIDFGIAREFTPDVTQSHTEKLSEGFAPIEQYFRTGKRGAYTDVYGLAATLYFLLTGKRPIPAINRDAEIRDRRKDSLVPPRRLNRKISDSVNQAVLQGMALEAKDRPQSMREWLRLVSLIWEPGDKLHRGKYTIENVLGNEDFIRTYLASDKNGKSVVIKTLNEVAQRRHDFTKLQQYFLKKARRIKKCKHRHIGRVHELFKQGLLWCIVMDDIVGDSLATYVANQGALREGEALLYIKQIGKALIALHNNRLLHLDVKPANIMRRTGEYEAVLIGFCIAPEFTADGTLSDDGTLSELGMVADRYAAPEQSLTPQKTSVYTDIYGLAATLYFLSTGQQPIPAIDRDAEIRKDPLVRPKQLNQQISDSVNKAILQGMALKAKKRPQSMREWLRLLEKQKVLITSGLQRTINIPWSFLSKLCIYITQRTISIPWSSLSIVCFGYTFIGWDLYTSQIVGIWYPIYRWYLFFSYLGLIFLDYLINAYKVSLTENHYLSIPGDIKFMINLTYFVYIMFIILLGLIIDYIEVEVFLSDWLLSGSRTAAVGALALAWVLAWIADIFFVSIWEEDEWILGMFSYNLMMGLLLSVFSFFGWNEININISLFAYWVLVGGLTSASRKLHNSFSEFHTFMSLAVTCGLGLGLGWLLAQIFP